MRIPTLLHAHHDAESRSLSPPRKPARNAVRGALACATAALALSVCLPAFAVDADTPAAPAASADSHPAADNTARNSRDRADTTLTPMDQSDDPHDLALTTDIRKALVDDEALGIDARNVKVIAKGDHVTLRGPVHTPAERDRIVEISTRIAGVTHVSNEIELIAP